MAAKKAETSYSTLFFPWAKMSYVSYGERFVQRSQSSSDLSLTTALLLLKNDNCSANHAAQQALQSKAGH